MDQEEVIDIGGKIFKASIEVLPFLNLALQQNSMPFVFELKLHNETDKDFSDIECRFSSIPGFVVSKTIHVVSLSAGQELVLRDLGIELDYTFLTSISDKVAGKVILDVACKDEILVHSEHSVDLFAVDQWLGLRVFPELLCTFVTPNMEVISHLMGDVARELEKRTYSSAIDGYQSGDRKRVYAICEAIFRVIHDWGINYSNPASSFGMPGQRIRFADMIYKYRLGTCLDLTLLFASVMEQCGLHPVIMLHTGHAYIGCHLEDHYFPDIPLDDLQTIRKLVDLDEFLVLETMQVAGNFTFSEAEATARKKHLNIDDSFHCAVDVIRARYSGISPLPLKRSIDGIELDPTQREVLKYRPEIQRKLQQEIDLSQASSSNAKGRIGRWQQKLLDLSLRNRLLNVRDTRQIIPIACSNIYALEDKIAANEAFTLNPLADLLSESDLHNLAMLRNTEIKDNVKDLLDNELNKHRLWSLLTPFDLLRRLTMLYRQSKNDLEEGGVNTLFLALGFLEWKASPKDEKSYQAPILLLPVGLTRKSLQSGIAISRLDEDTIVNVTLLEMLRREFELKIPGIDPLPTDDFGVDVERVMQIFRQTIKDMKGWEIREEARLGHFSFNKFIMWNDLTHRIDSLRQNPLVGHLINGGGLYDDGIEVFEPAEVEKHLDFKQLFCPASADSSQLTAVKYSESGKSFVLHGPPGTGKSQTITNIIAHNLALGRRVLFVSEKKAALDVVHRRLSAIGLRPFCLELHSNKTGKADVLKQFSEVLAMVDNAAPADWNTITDQLTILRDDLNRYVQSLHDSYPNGLSAYQCLSRMIIASDEYETSWLDLNLLEQSKEELQILKQAVTDLASAFTQVTPEAVEAFSFMRPLDWTPKLEKDLGSFIKELQDIGEALGKAYRYQAERLGFGSCPNLLDNIYQVALLGEVLKGAPDIPPEMIKVNFKNDAKDLLAGVRSGRRLIELNDKLGSYNTALFGEMDCDSLHARIKDNNSKFFLFKWLRNKALLKELSSLKKLGAAPLTINELISLLEPIREYSAVRIEFDQKKAILESGLGRLWHGGSPNWDDVEKSVDDALKINESIHACCRGDAVILENCFAELRNILPNCTTIYKRDSAEREKINQLLNNWNILHEKLDELKKLCGNSLAANSLDDLNRHIRNLSTHIKSLRRICLWRNQKENAVDLGLQGLAELLVSQKLPPEKAVEAFDYAYHRVMLDQILTVNPILRDFIGSTHNERIRKFCELDRCYLQLSQKITAARLTAALPRRRTGPCPEGTELGILKRECEKRARHKPVRQLLSSIPTLLQTLKPCFLMSPLSVAQYLPAEISSFDLVVFDEASQIPVWDAIGVTARAKQLIVVGDPKQMPPTNFFQKGDNEEPEIEEEIAEDMESILDECIAAGVHSSYLNWHYRSRHESLISFSNHYYYDDRLFTFPAATNAGHLGVKFIFVPDAIYDRKQSRTNVREAEILVQHIIKRLQNKETCHKSIGIVTFSQAQKDLIEDLLEQARNKHPKLEKFFSDELEEPLFVKNLENVQGDERDVILFSVCYAPDKDGKFSMNFGPLNRLGGERRLNVAITRAKEQVIVFSSIKSTQIDLARTRATGAAHLKYFLDYAEKGIHNTSAKAQQATTGEMFIQAVSNFLRDKGYQIQTNVGCSDYQIDIAVIHPEFSDRYLLGIECDGLNYRRNATGRDRDHLRTSVLGNLGWCMHRVWITDWYHDRENAEQNIIQAIEAALHAPPPEPASVIEDEDEMELESESDESSMTVQPIKRVHDDYEIWHSACEYPQEYFYEPRAIPVIRAQIASIVKTEAPVYEKLLRRRISKHWGFSRTGESIQRIISDCLPVDCPVSNLSGENVYWSGETTPASYRRYRVSSDTLTRRNIDEIPPEELANAMYEVLMDFQSCEQDTLFRETVRLFGFSAMTSKMKPYLEHGLKHLQQSGRI